MVPKGKYILLFQVEFRAYFFRGVLAVSFRATYPFGIRGKLSDAAKDLSQHFLGKVSTNHTVDGRIRRSLPGMYKTLVNNGDNLPTSTGAGFLNHQQWGCKLGPAHSHWVFQ